MWVLWFTAVPLLQKVCNIYRNSVGIYVAQSGQSNTFRVLVQLFFLIYTIMLNNVLIIDEF